MDNLFTTITSKLPPPRKKDADALAALGPQKAPENKNVDIAGMNTNELISMWQKDEKPEYTAELLTRMQPTIKSAISSYAPNSGDRFAVKSAHLTLDALRKFDVTMGVAPNTYVFNNLKRLNRYAAQTDNILKESEALSLERKLAREAFMRFEDDHDREPSLAELADITGLSVKKLDKLLEDNTVVSESSTLTQDSQKDTQTMHDVNDDDCFEYVYASVGPIDQKIMEWTSGKHGKPALSNNQIAARLRISAPAVSQRRNKIMQLMSDVRSLI